ncbi:hypothetical protein CP532_4113 [Ophiocordyceps camponoti-leonardi (nom. inval.)]|nr:hypothetical protein CP532_4113 [Ophiocordyceps camponoti-leonardi (nom. inval.)]
MPQSTTNDPESLPSRLSSLTHNHHHPSSFTTWPILGPLLFDNESSDARDHCANERSFVSPFPFSFSFSLFFFSASHPFLSYLRLATYMTVVAVAMTVSFQLNQQPSQLERRIARPLGIAFWLLSLVTLFMGVGNYITTVNKYGKKAAIVQTGWRTQLVLALLAFSIIGTCVVLLVTERFQR